MKKIIFAVLAVALLTGTSFADPKWFVGGSLDFGSSKYVAAGEDVKGSYFGIAPSLGYIIDDKSDVSVSIGYATGKQDIPVFDPLDDSLAAIATDETTTFSISAGYERLFLTVGSLYFYLWGGIEYSSTEYGESSQDSNNINISIAPNVQYGLTDNVILFINLNFLSLNFDAGKDISGENYTDFSFGADSNNVLTVGHDSPLTIGFSYLF